MLKEVFVITTDGTLYIADCDGYGREGFEYKFEFCFLWCYTLQKYYPN